MTSEAFAEVLALIEDEHSMTFTSGRRDLWWLSLKAFPDDIVQRAVIDMLNVSPYPPKLAHLIEGLRPSKETREAEAAVAWMGAMRAIENLYASVQFEDKTIPLVLEALGGRRLLAEKKAEELSTFTRREFERIYLAFRAEGRQHFSDHIAGLIEAENKGRGIDTDFPLIHIGREDQLALDRPMPDRQLVFAAVGGDDGGAESSS